MPNFTNERPSQKPFSLLANLSFWLAFPRILWYIDRLAVNPTLKNVFALTDLLVGFYDQEKVEKFEQKIRTRSDFQAFWQAYQEPNSPLKEPFDPVYLASLPSNTLGYHLSQFWQQNKIDPNPFLFVEKKEEKNLILLTRNRILKTHDIWHILTGFPMTPIGEYGLQAFSLAQQVSLSSFAIMFAGFWRILRTLQEKEIRSLMNSVCHGYESGKNSQPLVYLIWENMWEEDLNSIRQKLKS